MPKPLRSADPNPRENQFSHFGVLDDGQRSKSAAFISVGINVSILLTIVILGLIVKNNPVAAKKLAEIYLPPPAPKPPPPPPPKNPPVMPPKVLPDPPKIKITTPPPPEKLPEIVKMQPTPPKPLPPTPEVKILAPPAPKIVSLGNPKAAAVANNDPHPSAVRLGSTSSPIVTTGAAVSPVNMNLGVPGMPGSNTGNGPHAKAVTLGNGLPGGANLNGHTSSVTAVHTVNIGGSVAPPATTRPVATASLVASPPKVLYKPTPTYTAEAKAMHLEGNVSLKIRVLASGGVEVISVVHGLGHGLDESARQATMATRFKPAVDGEGRAVDWEGTVVVNFQMS